MVSRTQIVRIARSVDRIASVMRPAAVSYVPLYQDETETDALAAYCEEFGMYPTPGRTVFNRTRPGDRRAACKASGMHLLHCLGPADTRELLMRVDGKIRGIPTCSTLTGEKGATA
jgi:hypothetical protein